jgi:hypothetical protein
MTRDDTCGRAVCACRVPRRRRLEMNGTRVTPGPTPRHSTPCDTILPVTTAYWRTGRSLQYEYTRHTLDSTHHTPAGRGRGNDGDARETASKVESVGTVRTYVLDGSVAEGEHDPEARPPDHAPAHERPGSSIETDESTHKRTTNRTVSQSQGPSLEWPNRQANAAQENRKPHFLPSSFSVTMYCKHN